jgi:hypothetical protein
MEAQHSLKHSFQHRTNKFQMSSLVMFNSKPPLSPLLVFLPLLWQVDDSWRNLGQRLYQHVFLLLMAMRFTKTENTKVTK